MHLRHDQPVTASSGGPSRTHLYVHTDGNFHLGGPQSTSAAAAHDFPHITKLTSYTISPITRESRSAAAPSAVHIVPSLAQTRYTSCSPHVSDMWPKLEVECFSAVRHVRNAEISKRSIRLGARRQNDNHTLRLLNGMPHSPTFA